MKTTLDVITALRRANPTKTITEDRVRHALRRGDIDPPETFGGRLAWSDENILALANALGVIPTFSLPSVESRIRDVGGSK